MSGLKRVKCLLNCLRGDEVTPMRKYIFGFITGICLLPILDSITELVQVALEIPKGNLSKKVMIINGEIQDIQAQLEPVSTNCIGFEVPNGDEYYEDEDKHNVGF